MTNGKLDIYIVILNQGVIDAELAKTMIQMLCQETEYNIIFACSQRIMVDNNRNNIVKVFLENKWDYLIMIDEDNPPTNNILDLIKLDLDIVCFPTPMIRKEVDPPIFFNIFERIKDAYKPILPQKGKLMEIDAGGSGCILIKRKVLENIKKPFESEWKEDGTRGKSSDLKFCEKAKEKGFKIYTHWDYPCSHYKKINLLDIISMITKYPSQ